MRALICVFVSPAYFSSCQALMQLHPHICRGLPPPISTGLSRGPGAPDSRLINHGAWVMTPHCSPNVFWREPLPLALSSRRHTYGRSEWVTGPLLRVWHPARRKPSAPHIDTHDDNHTHTHAWGKEESDWREGGNRGEVPLGQSSHVKVNCQEQSK